jgi:hypothetical protein
LYNFILSRLVFTYYFELSFQKCPHQPMKSSVGALRNIDRDAEGSSCDGPTGDSQTSIVSTVEQVTFQGSLHVVFSITFCDGQTRFSGFQVLKYFLLYFLGEWKERTDFGIYFTR